MIVVDAVVVVVEVGVVIVVVLYVVIPLVSLFLNEEKMTRTGGKVMTSTVKRLWLWWFSSEISFTCAYPGDRLTIETFPNSSVE